MLTARFSFQNCDKMNIRNLLTLKCSHKNGKLFNPRDNLKRYSTDDDEEDEIDGESQPSSPHLTHKPITDRTSSTEWIGITTNSEECSYSSADNSGSQIEYSENNGCELNDHFTPTVILNSNCAIGDRSEYETRQNSVEPISNLKQNEILPIFYFVSYNFS